MEKLNPAELLAAGKLSLEQELAIAKYSWQLQNINTSNLSEDVLEELKGLLISSVRQNYVNDNIKCFLIEQLIQ